MNEPAADGPSLRISTIKRGDLAVKKGLSAGLIGPPGTPRTYQGSLSGTPIFIGCSDIDPHIPVDRVHESCRALRTMDAVVTERIYPGLGHTINEDEIARVGKLLSGVSQVRAV